MAVETSSPDELRRRLGVHLKDYSSSLRHYFPDVPLVDNRSAQAEEFHLRRRHRQRELQDWVRQIRIKVFDEGTIQDDWLEIRELAFLGPDPDWATTLDEVSTERMDARIQEQMADRVGPRPLAAGELPDFELIRESNGRPLQARVAEAQRLVCAWSNLKQIPAPALWVKESFDVDVRRRLEQAAHLTSVNSPTTTWHAGCTQCTFGPRGWSSPSIRRPTV